MACQSTELVLGFKEVTEISTTHYDRIIGIKTKCLDQNEVMFADAKILRCFNSGFFGKLESLNFTIMGSVSVYDMSVVDWFINKLENGVYKKKLSIEFRRLKDEKHLEEFQKILLCSCVPVSEKTEIDGKVVLDVVAVLSDLSKYHLPLSKFITQLMFTSMFPIIHQELISSCPNLEDVNCK
ncbi:unnamed protein product [Ambrosiozyma monospora]|uniref:Unnamed protein product n=1 Tax=Ambrosiozyma monospora TaxID=43982 RepID=A0ACB5TZJ0_AMBMO|nr:unnamed protein product [Ambrosiozyma monospora]